MSIFTALKNRFILLLLFVCCCIVFYGCGSTDGGLSDWVTGPDVIRVSNLKGRLIGPIGSARSNRAEAYFPLVTTQGAKVFLESDSSKFAIADSDGYFVIPSVPAGKHRLVASIVQGATTYRQRSDVVVVSGQYETQVMSNSIVLEPALYTVTMHLSDLKTSSPLWGRVNLWGYTFEALNGLVSVGPFPGNTMSKEVVISALGYRDLKTLIGFGPENNSELYIQMTPNTSTDGNLAPVVEIYQPSLMVRTNEEIDVSGVGVDPEGDLLTWKWAASKGSFYNDKSQRTTFLTPSTPGSVQISLIGTDSKGAFGKATLNLNVSQGSSPGVNPQNKPPRRPSNPFPADMANNMGGSIALSWDCSDPNYDKITYTVNFGKQLNGLKTIATDLEEPTILVKDLEVNTKYYWQVTAYDEYYASADSLLWQFETGDLNNNPPNMPAYPSPTHMATGISSGSIAFAWSGGDPDGDAVTYKVYLATASTWVSSQSASLTLIHSTNLSTCDYSGLENGATYLWQVIAVDRAGAMTEGPVWQFSTEEPENHMPSFASLVEPADGSTDVALTQKLRWTASDEDNDELFYDVYFGKNAVPSLVSASQPQQIYDPGLLEADTTYYWRVVVSDGRIVNPHSDLWSFKTAPVADEKPRVVGIAQPSSYTEPLKIVFSEYINNSNQSEAFSFKPPVSGNWTWKENNTVAEFLPSSGNWYEGSFNKFYLAANILEDATGNKLDEARQEDFVVPSKVRLPAGYRSFAFPMVLSPNTTTSISIPDLSYGANSYMIAIADSNDTAISVSSLRACFEADSFVEKDKTQLLRLAEAEMIRRPIPEVSRSAAVRASVNAAVIGEEREFFINAIATSTPYPKNKITATLAKASGNTIVYLDNAITDGDKYIKAQEVLTVFDNRILQKVRDNFGNEPELGIDGESRIAVVLFKLPENNSTAGYFNSADLYPRDVYEESNEGKIFYIKYGMEEITTFGTLAHEFQHMINYYQKNKLGGSAEEIWLNEALSKYSEEVCGYSVLDGDKNTATLIKYSMEHNKTQSLTYWQGSGTINFYGQVYLFMHFLAHPKRYLQTSAEVTRRLVTGNGTALKGEANVEAVTGEPFKETMAKWALSLYLNKYFARNPKAYAIHNIDLKGTYNGVSLPGYEIENVTSAITVSGMLRNSIRCFRKTSTGNGDTAIKVTTGSQGITLWLFDERD